MPVFDGVIRKRPLAVQNEGSAPAFISCSFMGNTSIPGITDVVLYANSNNASATSLTCMLVTGVSGGSDAPRYLAKTVTMPGNSRLNQFSWRFEEFGLLDNLTSASCNLPVGTGLTLSEIHYVK